jgi:DNA invertase Pin-like site-specific DNA recombinase
VALDDRPREDESGVNAVALYLRVSTEDQDLAGQERELRAYASSRGWMVGRVYAEKISASGRVERAAFEKLRRDALELEPAERGFERVLVWALDRWSREPSFVRAIGSLEELERRGVRWHSLKEPALDSSEDGGASLARDLLRGILPTIAAFEARRRSDRTKVSMEEIRAGRRPTRSGRPIGRPRKVTPAHVRQIQELRDTRLPNGKRRTWAAIALAVHLPAGTCKNAYSDARGAHQHEKPLVENGPGDFRDAEETSPPEPRST